MITSRNNPLIVESARLKNKKYRTTQKAYLIEGNKLFFEAVKSRMPIKRIYATEDWLEEHQMKFPADVIPVSKPVLEKLSALKSQEGVIAELRLKKIKEPRFNKAIILDNINDPGNLGTIIRTADCAGFGQIFLYGGCADLYNQKTLRASMGSVFHVAVTRIKKNVIDNLRTQGFELIATALDGKEIYMNEIVVPDKYCLVFGNEANGISKEVLKLCDKRIKIPVRGKAQSLNVAIASAVIMYAYTDQSNERAINEYI